MSFSWYFNFVSKRKYFYLKEIKNWSFGCEMKHGHKSSSSVRSSERSEAPKVNTGGSQGLHVMEFFCSRQKRVQIVWNVWIYYRAYKVKAARCGCAHLYERRIDYLWKGTQDSIWGCLGVRMKGVQLSLYAFSYLKTSYHVNMAPLQK